MLAMTGTTDDYDNVIEDPTKSPSVAGEESPSGGATSSESMDIDEELKKVGLHGDSEKSPGSLDLEDELQEEEL